MARYNYYYSIDFIELTDFMTFSVINRRATAIIKVNTQVAIITIITGNTMVITKELMVIIRKITIINLQATIIRIIIKIIAVASTKISVLDESINFDLNFAIE